RLSARLALVGGRRGRGTAAVSAPQGPRLRVRADHGEPAAGSSADAGLSVRNRLDGGALGVAAGAGPRGLDGGRDRLAGAAVDPAAASGPARPALRLRAVVSQSSRVRSVWMGSPRLVSGGRVLRRIRDL